MSDMTIEKARDMLLENEYKQIEKNGNKTSNVTAFAYCNFDK